MKKSETSPNSMKHLQETLFDTPPDWSKHWVGMPEFVQEKQEPYAKIIVRFSCKEDLDDFAAIIGQKLTRETKSIWHPKLVRGFDSKKIYVSES